MTAPTEIGSATGEFWVRKEAEKRALAEAELDAQVDRLIDLLDSTSGRW